MHYCQECGDSPLMDAYTDGIARCTRCGSTDDAAACRPLLIVVGASGSGKTTVFPKLARRLAGDCIVFDADWLIDPLGGDVTTLDWDVLRDSWLHIAHGVAQNGMPTMLLGALLPEQLEGLKARRWISEIHYLLLDCDDDVRRRRIDDRPAGRTHDVDRQLAFARVLRDRFTTVVDTSTDGLDDTVERIASWAQGVLDPA